MKFGYISFYVFFLLIICHENSSGQVAYLKGRVYDQQSGEPLIGVNIIMDTGEGTTTDFEGNYRLKSTPGKHRVTFTYLGYKKVEKTVELLSGIDVTLDVGMTYGIQALDIVVISASQFEKNIAEETVSMDVVDESLMESTNATEIGEAIDKSVGVQVQDGQITIRSGSSYSYGVGSRTAVMVDNLSMHSADLGEAQLRHIPVEEVKQIEVIKGASSVVYGSSALNGVVNILTAWPKNKEPEAEFQIYQTFYDNPKREEWIWWRDDETPNASGIFFNYQQKFERFDLVAGGNTHYLKSYLEVADELRLRGNFKTRYRPPKYKGLSFGLNGNIMFDKSGRFFIAIDLDSNAYRNASPNIDRYLRSNLDPHLTYINERGQKHSFRMRWLNVYRDGRGSVPDASTHNFTGEYQYQGKFRESVVVTVGMPFNFGISRSNLYTGTRINYSGALYVQGEYKSERLSVVGGLRYEFSRVDSIFDATTPVFRSGLNYRVGNNTFLRASWGQAYRLPSIGERFITAEFANLHIFPNPALKVEKGWGMEVGIKEGLRIKNWQGFFDFSLFLNEYDNLVEYRLGIYPSPGEPATFEWLGLKPFNVDRARVAGFEASIVGKGSIGPVSFSTLTGYTYSYPGNLEKHPEQKNLGKFFKNAGIGLFKRFEGADAEKILTYRVRHLIKGDFEWRWQQYGLGYTIYYSSFPETFEELYYLAIQKLDEFVEEHIHGDVIMGLRAFYERENRFRFSFIIKNLTNREYSTRAGKLDPPRNFTLQLKFYLGKS